MARRETRAVRCLREIFNDLGVESRLSVDTVEALSRMVLAQAVFEVRDELAQIKGRLRTS